MDAEAKADFNALKNYWDGIDKDHAAWSKDVSVERLHVSARMCVCVRV